MAVGRARNYQAIRRSYATGTVAGKAAYVGGFLGSIEATGHVNLDDDPRVEVTEVFTNVNVNPTNPNSGNLYAGGLVGFLRGGNINDINVVGAVHGRNSVGGIVGYAVNDDPNTDLSTLRDALFRNDVIDYATAGRAGLVGYSRGDFSRCDWGFWDSNTDTGTAWATPQGDCQPSISDAVLKAPHPAPNVLMSPFTHGLLLGQAEIDYWGFEQCKLGSGSDGDWGFNTCPLTTNPPDDVWLLNASNQHISLKYIPNPSVQPL